MNYHDFLFFHIILFIFFISAGTAWLFSSDKKYLKILFGLLSFLTFSSGFMLLARLGIPHKGPYPSWVWGKLSIWIFVSAFVPLAVKWKKSKASQLFIILIILMSIASWFAVYKPL